MDATIGNMKNPARSSGFTLIELSMVLVIIGLIVGGVLVGQDLIKTSEIRATIGQLEKYNTAVNTFRSKYAGIPGDLPNAAAFGFVARAGAFGRGDGDGSITGDETLLFWSDLSAANLVEGSFTAAIDTANTTYAAASLPALLPIAKLNRSAYVVAVQEENSYTRPNNYFVIAGLKDFTVNTASVVNDPGLTFGANSVIDVLTPRQAYAIDLKIDDGLPQKGRVVGYEQGGGTYGLEIMTLGSDQCTTLFPNVYDLSAANADHVGCRIFASFQ
jgi:prepilin-type N-terminal cleavage/methylation domain-containing protein